MIQDKNSVTENGRHSINSFIHLPNLREIYPSTGASPSVHAKSRCISQTALVGCWCERGPMFIRTEKGGAVRLREGSMRKRG